MEAIFYFNESDSRYVDKTLTEIETLTGAFKQPFIVSDPIIMLSKNIDVLTYNYVYIPDTERYYYVTAQPTYENGYYNVPLHEDVLTSLKDQYIDLYAIIARQEFEWSAYLKDDRFPVLNKQQINTLMFENGFSYSNAGLLIVNGQG